MKTKAVRMFYFNIGLPPLQNSETEFQLKVGIQFRYKMKTPYFPMFEHAFDRLV